MENLKNHGYWNEEGKSFTFTENNEDSGVLPKELLDNASTLESISFSYGSLNQLPIWISKFKNLKHISINGAHLSGDSARDFGLELLATLPNLARLDISNNKNIDISPVRNIIHQLNELLLSRISNNDLGFISAGKSLAKLTLRHCDNDLKFITALSNLTSLEISTNNANLEFPEIGTLHKLTELTINHDYFDDYDNLNNSIYDSIASRVGDCTQLTSLSLHSNILAKVDFSKLSMLTNLDCSIGDFESFPINILNAQSLVNLELSSCSLKEVPKEIDSLPNLRYLRLSGNEITELPDTVVNLSLLSTLDIVANKITDLPVGLALMPNLQTFLYYNNPLDKESLFSKYNLIGIYKLLQEKEREKINVAILQVPDILKSAFQEYLVYFDEYYKNISGNNIGFSVTKHELGLKIELELVDDLDILDVQSALAKYTQYLIDKDFDVENAVEVDKLVKDLQILKLTLETKSNHFEQQTRILELSHQLIKDENKYLRQIVTQFASKENVFLINQQTSNQNSPHLLNTNSVIVKNEIEFESFKEIAQILEKVFGSNHELEVAVDELEKSTEIGKRSLISSALSKVVDIVTNTIDKAHIFLVDAPEVVEKLKTALSMAQAAANKGHFTEIAKMLNNILHSL